jgi:CcmD family protein
MTYLYAAYAVTWLILLGYVVSLSRRASRVRREIEELQK